MSLRPPFDKFEREAPHCFADWRLIHVWRPKRAHDPIIENKVMVIVPGLRASWVVFEICRGSWSKPSAAALF